MYQIAAYALLDFAGEYQIDSAGIFLARYAYLAQWPVQRYLSVLAGHDVDVKRARRNFMGVVYQASPLAESQTIHIGPGNAAVGRDGHRKALLGARRLFSVWS